MQYTLCSSKSFADSLISSFNIAMNADNVLPEPVGLDIRVFCLLCMFIIENVCGGLNDWNFPKNQSFTRGMRVLEVSSVV